MSSDDLSGLFGPAPVGAAANAQFRQGVVLSFSPEDGSNEILVAGGVIPNVPMLLTGAEINLTAGDPVILMILGYTYMIIGKVAMVGSEQFASASTATVGFSNEVLNTSYTASANTTITTATFEVPTWANRMAFAAAAEHSFHGTVDGDMGSQVDMNGNFSGQSAGWAAANHTVQSTKFMSGVETVTPGATVSCSGQFACSVSGTVTIAIVSGFAVFSKE